MGQKLHHMCHICEWPTIIVKKSDKTKLRCRRIKTGNLGSYLEASFVRRQADGKLKN